MDKQKNFQIKKDACRLDSSRAILRYAAGKANGLRSAARKNVGNVPKISWESVLME